MSDAVQRVPLDHVGTRKSSKEGMIELGIVVQDGTLLILDLLLEEWEIVKEQGYIEVRKD